MDGKWQVSQVHDELVPQSPSSGLDVLLLGRSGASLGETTISSLYASVNTYHSTDLGLAKRTRPHSEEPAILAQVS